MIEEVDSSVLKEAGTGRQTGPQMRKTENAQVAVDEFLQSGMDIGKVDWESICDNFDLAKGALSYRISYTKNMLEGEAREAAQDLGLRSNRRKREIFIVHTKKL